MLRFQSGKHVYRIKNILHYSTLSQWDKIHIILLLSYGKSVIKIQIVLESHSYRLVIEQPIS